MTTSLFKRTFVSSLVVAAALNANADNIAGTSYGFGLDLDVTAGSGATLGTPILGSTVLLNASAGIGRLPVGADGTAPGPFGTGPLSFAGVDASSVTGLSLGGGLLTGAANLAAASGTFNGEAESDVDLSAGVKTALGIGSVENLNLNLVDLSISTGVVPVILFDPLALANFSQDEGTVLQSDSTVTGDYNAFTRTGVSQIANLTLNLLGQGEVGTLSDLLDALNISYTLAGGVLTDVPPNTEITLGVGSQAVVNGTLPGLGTGLGVGTVLNAGAQLILTLNEQDLFGNPVSNPGITTTALHVRFELPDTGLGASADGGVGIGLATLALSGNVDLYLGQSSAQLTAVPEPSTYVAGIAVVTAVTGAWMRNRRRQNGEKS